MLKPGLVGRAGVTAVELLVALTLAGLVLALIASLAVRQQRIFGDLADAEALEAHLRETASVVAVDLRTLAPALGDIRDARDTALEIRATIASGVVCDATPTALLLAPETDAPSGFTSISTPIEAGDTAWLLSIADMSDDWRPLAIAATSSACAGQCGRLGPQLGGSDLTIARTAITVDAASVTGIVSPSSSPVGLPVRITRPVRYSLYHASDGLWYLGERDWNASTQRFNTIQPLAGPLLPASSGAGSGGGGAGGGGGGGGGGGLTFTYLDRAGVPVATPVADPSAIAFVRVDARGETRTIVRALGAAGPTAKGRDSIAVIVGARGS